ncbi:hypothetical protein IGI04_037251 [Brassica rapa subsp. trilocularis]|uniref:PPM-type phosphatase domain-containing protein n=1 Tax=Brassica rapa subsp. trilocularis TaxID=1813537 RepID=A0ABQ7LJ28_BRACM|nr:hypothetical protein IGI04_037251 [Brassica rapa subsp. trilocularis]
MFFPQVCSFPIYDGHGGCLAAEFAKKHLHLNVFQLGYRQNFYMIGKDKRTEPFEGLSS